MAKVVLDDLSTTLANSAAATLNANNTKLEAALEKTLSRDGTGPNHMEADFDLNHNDILNADNIHADVLVLNGQTVTPIDLANLPATVMLKTTYDPNGVNADVFNRRYQGDFNTESDFTSANIPTVVQYVTTAGYYSVGDGGGHVKKRVATPAPVEAWHKQSSDGAWWQISENVVAPEMLGAKPGDNTFDSTDAINNSFDMGFVVSGVSRVTLSRGNYYCAGALRPVARQSSPSNFEMPYEIECRDSALVAQGTGHGSETFFRIAHNTVQKSVVGGVIIGELWFLNDGDWRDLVSFTGCNDWMNTGKIKAGRLDVPTSTSAQSAVRHNIRFESNGGKGGLWNDWGDIESYGGVLPLYVGPVANANRFGQVKCSYGTDGLVYDEGERNKYEFISGEFSVGQTPKYCMQVAGGDTATGHFGETMVNWCEFESQDSNVALNPNWQAVIWVTKGMLVGTGMRYTLGSDPFVKVSGGGVAWCDFKHVNNVSGRKRIERIVLPAGAAWDRNVALAKAPKRFSQAVTALGVSGTYGAFTTIFDGDYTFAVDAKLVKVTNNTDQSFTVSLSTNSFSDVETHMASGVTIAIGASYTFTYSDFGLAFPDGDPVRVLKIRGRTGAASFTGSLLVEAMAYML